jgi:hypothetical protein
MPHSQGVESCTKSLQPLHQQSKGSNCRNRISCIDRLWQHMCHCLQLLTHCFYWVPKRCQLPGSVPPAQPVTAESELQRGSAPSVTLSLSQHNDCCVVSITLEPHSISPGSIRLPSELLQLHQQLPKVTPALQLPQACSPLETAAAKQYQPKESIQSCRWGLDRPRGRLHCWGSQSCWVKSYSHGGYAACMIASMVSCCFVHRPNDTSHLLQAAQHAQQLQVLRAPRC